LTHYPKIGIRPILDGRWGGTREGMEEQTRNMAVAAKQLIQSHLRYSDGTPVQCVIAQDNIGGGEEAARCALQFAAENVCATLSVTPCWCYGSETFDMDPMTIKAVWGLNATERPGAVYLAAVLAAHAQRGLPAFSIYSRDVQDADDSRIPGDVQEKILKFVKCALAVGEMRHKSYVNIGSVSMGIAGSHCDPLFFQKYLGMRDEWVDMTEVLRRMALDIYDPAEYEMALAWTKANCPEGFDPNEGKELHPIKVKSRVIPKEKTWEFMVKHHLIVRDILFGNPKLAELGWNEEALGRNAIAGGFQGQRMWSDWLPNADFIEAIMASTFDWRGPRRPTAFATENDTLNAVSMLFGTLLTHTAPCFHDVRTYWSPLAVERVTGQAPQGAAQDGFIHLINSGATALDATGCSRDERNQPTMKPFWQMTQADIDACLRATDWCPATTDDFRGGGFSSHFRTQHEMPVTMLRVNLIDGLGPALQVAEGRTVVLEDAIHDSLDARTNPSWPTTWFVPRLTQSGAFRDVYSVMANWGANHGVTVYGHVGDLLITLASMLRIPVTMHNVPEERIFRPHCWAAFGADDAIGADMRACKQYGPLYR
jgi:L-fucose isomerase